MSKQRVLEGKCEGLYELSLWQDPPEMFAASTEENKANETKIEDAEQVLCEKKLQEQQTAKPKLIFIRRQ